MSLPTTGNGLSAQSNAPAMFTQSNQRVLQPPALSLMGFRGMHPMSHHPHQFVMNHQGGMIQLPPGLLVPGSEASPVPTSNPTMPAHFERQALSVRQ